MARFVVIYDDCDENLRIAHYAYEENLADALNNPDDVFHKRKILEEFPGSGSLMDGVLWNAWPDNSMMIFRDGDLYVPKRVTQEVMMQVEKWEVE